MRKLDGRIYRIWRTWMDRNVDMKGFIAVRKECFATSIVDVYSLVQAGSHFASGLGRRRLITMIFVLSIYVALLHQGNAGYLREQHLVLLENNTNTMYDCLEFMTPVDSLLKCALHCTSALMPHAIHGFTSSGQLCACYPFSHEILISQPLPVQVYIEKKAPGRPTILCLPDIWKYNKVYYRTAWVAYTGIWRPRVTPGRTRTLSGCRPQVAPGHGNHEVCTNPYIWHECSSIFIFWSIQTTITCLMTHEIDESCCCRQRVGKSPAAIMMIPLNSFENGPIKLHVPGQVTSRTWRAGYVNVKYDMIILPFMLPS